MPNWNIEPVPNIRFTASSNTSNYDPAIDYADTRGPGFSVQVLNAFIGKGVSGAELRMVFNNEVFVETGESRRCNEDKHDPEVAALYAYGRALEKLAKRLIKRADGLVKQRDDLRNNRVEHSKREVTLDSISVGDTFDIAVDEGAIIYTVKGVEPRENGVRFLLKANKGVYGNKPFSGHWSAIKGTWKVERSTKKGVDYHLSYHNSY